MIASDTGAMLKAGGIEDQPDWFIELLGWFTTRLDFLRFAAKAKMVLGSGGGAKAQTMLAAKRGGGGRGGHNR